MVASPEQWPWSSDRARAGLTRCPEWLTTDPLFSQFGADRRTQQQAWRNFVLEKVPAADELLDRCVAQMYLGTASWIDRVQALLDAIAQSHGTLERRLVTWFAFEVVRKSAARNSAPSQRAG